MQNIFVVIIFENLEAVWACANSVKGKKRIIEMKIHLLLDISCFFTCRHHTKFTKISEMHKMEV